MVKVRYRHLWWLFHSPGFCVILPVEANILSDIGLAPGSDGSSQQVQKAEGTQV